MVHTGTRWQSLCRLNSHTNSHVFATETEKSQPVNIPDAAKRKKKKRTRATDSSTGTFDGNKLDISETYYTI